MELEQLAQLKEFVRVVVGEEGDLPENMDITDIRQFVKDAVNRNLTVLNDVYQPTVSECEQRLPGGRDLESAINAGYPLPEEGMLQREFLKIEERKLKLSELRVAGDMEALAKYELDSFNAIFSGLMGYRPAIYSDKGKKTGDNATIKSLLDDDYRGCGGMAVQCSYWIKELGLTAFLASALQGSSGYMGHISFFVMDSRDNVFIFDPATRRTCTPVFGEFYEEQGDLLGNLKKLLKSELKSFRMSAKDAKNAYVQEISPYVVIKNLDDGLYDVLSYWGFINSKQKPDQATGLIDVLYDEGSGNEDDIPTHLRYLKILSSYERGDVEETRAQLTSAIANNPYCTLLKRYHVEFLLTLENSSDFKVLMDSLFIYWDLLVSIIVNYLAKIDISLNDFSKPGMIYRINNCAAVFDFFEDFFDESYMVFKTFLVKIRKNKELDYSESIVFAQTMNNFSVRIFQNFLTVLNNLEGYVFCVEMEDKINLSERAGKVCLAYARLQGVWNSLMSVFPEGHEDKA